MVTKTNNIPLIQKLQKDRLIQKTFPFKHKKTKNRMTYKKHSQRQKILMKSVFRINVNKTMSCVFFGFEQLHFCGRGMLLVFFKLRAILFEEFNVFTTRTPPLICNNTYLSSKSN